MKNKKVLKIKTRCPECESTLIYYRIKDDQFVCRSCGHKWIKEKK